LEAPRPTTRLATEESHHAADATPLDAVGAAVEAPRGYLARMFAATEEENRRAILRALPSDVGGRVLDLGTHVGEFTARVAERVGAREVHGVELLEKHAREARTRGIRVVQADVEEGIPFESRYFDVVHANQLIEHVRNTDLLASEIHRVLRPNGLAVISTNNMSSWHNIVSLTLGFQPFPMHVSDRAIVGNPLNPQHGRPHADAGRIHVRLFTGRALAELGAHHGLFPVHVKSAGYYPFPPRLGRLAAKLDSLHGAFLVVTFRRA
jgi:SAM-dependent methyltransferase